MRSDPTQSSPSKAAPLDSQDRRHLPGATLAPELPLMGVDCLLALWVSRLRCQPCRWGAQLWPRIVRHRDSYRGRAACALHWRCKARDTRWRLRRRVGHRPSEAEVRDELWRARDARLGALAKIVGTVSQMLRAGKGAASTVGTRIDQIQEDRSADKLRRGEEVEQLSADAAIEALQRYKNQRPGMVIDDAHIQFRSYTSQAAYRDDSLRLVAAGWYEQADPTLRYTIGRDGFIVIMWRHSSWHRPVGG